MAHRLWPSWAWKRGRGGPCQSAGQQPPLLLRGHWPPSPITAAPLEPAGTSTWSCCYRGWEPTGGLGPAVLASSPGRRVVSLMPTHQGFLGPRDPRSMFFLLRLLIIRAHTWSPRTSLLLWAKSSLSPSSAHKAGSGFDLQLPGSLCPLCHPHALCPQVPCSLLSFPTRAGPQFQVGPQWPPPSALCPPFLPQPQGRGTARASVRLQGPPPAQIPGAGPR